MFSLCVLYSSILVNVFFSVVSTPFLFFNLIPFLYESLILGISSYRDGSIAKQVLNSSMYWIPVTKKRMMYFLTLLILEKKYSSLRIFMIFSAIAAFVLRKFDNLEYFTLSTAESLSSADMKSTSSSKLKLNDSTFFLWTEGSMNMLNFSGSYFIAFLAFFQAWLKYSLILL